VGDATAWAVGAQGAGVPPTAELWDGTAFSLVATPDLGPGDSGLNSVTAIGPNDVWAAGFHLPGQSYTSVAEHWDGTGWTVSSLQDAGPATNSLFGVASAGTNAVWAVGEATVGDVYQTLMERWDGSGWTIVATPDAPASGSNALESVVAIDPTHAWAVGYEWDLAAVAYRTLTMQTTDGATWQIVSSPNPSNDDDVLLRASAASANDVWAVGYQTSGSAFFPLAEHWDGTQWTASSVPAPPGSFAILRGVTVIGPGDVWAVGAWYDPATGRYEPLVEHYDGSAWSIVPGPVAAGDTELIGIGSGPTGQIWAVGKNQTKPSSALTQRLCPIWVADAGFAPSSARPAQGSAVAWSFPLTNSASHSVTDASGVGLFDSGLRLPGGSFVFTFLSAGTYSIVDSGTGNTAKVQVPTLATPKAGGVGDTYTITWSTASAPDGFVFDVAIKRPGAAWTHWATLATPSAAFVPDAGVGTYQFHARLRNLVNKKKVAYSLPATITVS
jgi:hypothetical protein